MKIFGYEITIKKEVNWYNPTDWPVRHRFFALRRAKKAKDPVLAIRQYGIEKFGNLPQVGHTEKFVEDNL